MNGKPVFTVPSKTVLNMDSGFVHKLLCDGPTFSTGSACTYSCAFCYVPDTMRKQGHWLHDHGVRGEHKDVVIRRADPVSVLRQQLTDRSGAPKYGDPKDRRVIYSSPLVDIAGNMELVRETVEACRTILDLTHWQIRLLSKSNLLPKVAEALEDWYNGEGSIARYDSKKPCITYPISPRARVIYGVSTGTLDDKLARAFEAGAPLVSKRIESLHWLQDRGFRTYGMICPSLPQRDHKGFARRMAQAIRADQCEHVWAEVINLRGESFTRTVTALEEAGFSWESNELRKVSADRQAWESYARTTFNAHVSIYKGRRGPDKTPKLRFMQYVTSSSRLWWTGQQSRGAILL